MGEKTSGINTMGKTSTEIKDCNTHIAVATWAMEVLEGPVRGQLESTGMMPCMAVVCCV